MLSAIELDDQPAFRTGEISEVRADLMLASKFSPAQPAIAQVKPKPCFGIALIAPQFTCTFGIAPHPYPLPALRGEGV